MHQFKVILYPRCEILIWSHENVRRFDAKFCTHTLQNLIFVLMYTEKSHIILINRQESDSIYHFLIDLEILLVPNQSQKGDYNPKLVWFNMIQKRFLCAHRKIWSEIKLTCRSVVGRNPKRVEQHQHGGRKCNKLVIITITFNTIQLSLEYNQDTMMNIYRDKKMTYNGLHYWER